MSTILASAPLIALSAGAVIGLLADGFRPRAGKRLPAGLALLSLGTALAFLASAWGENHAYFGGTLLLDDPAIVIAGIVLVLVALVILIGLKPDGPQDESGGAVYPLLLLAAAGILVMASTSDLLVVFVGLELLSVSCYALAGLATSDPKSNEAAAKYVLLGGFASAFLVFGLAFLYGAGGGTDLSSILSAGRPGAGALALVGWSFFAVGLGFKIALVPFHGWAPDVYEGAPTVVSAFLSVGPKAAGLTVLVRIALAAAPGDPSAGALARVLVALAALTMVAGNLGALRQTNLKRLLAYSSIAHSGYLLLAVLARSWSGLLFYLAAYLFMNVGVFAILPALRRANGEEAAAIDDLTGIGFRYPWLGACLAIGLLSLAGFPPTAGFLAKFLVFAGAVREGWVGLVVVAVVATLISAYYYLRVIVVLYTPGPSSDVSPAADAPALYFVLFLCALAVIVLGLWPGNVLLLVRRAAGGF